MHSRAYMFLERDYIYLQRNPAWGIEAHPLDQDNFFEWTATLRGLKDTVWEGGHFVVSLKFPESYNDEPPDVYFHTIPFHPNIDPRSGRPCVDFLDNRSLWRDSFSVHHILLTLQFLLSNPVPENAINTEAARMCAEQPDMYMKTVVDCVKASQQLFGGQTNRRPTGADIEQTHDLDDRFGGAGSYGQLSKVSFEEYLATWTGIATSKPQADLKNPLLEAIKNDSKLQAAHFGLSLEDLHEQMKKQLSEHNAIMYGKFGKGDKPQDAQGRRLDHISRMRKIYLPRRSAPPPSTSAAQSVDLGEPWDGDAEDLVAWTNNLDEEDLEF